MAISGIDTQIMVTRAADVVKESSTLLKKNELVQDYLAVQSKALDQHEKGLVKSTVEAQEAKLNPDKEGSAETYFGRGSSREKNKDDDKAQSDHMVPAEEHIIDIKI